MIGNRIEKASLEELLHIRDILSEHVSRNEELGEVRTADLPYIATDYFIAQKCLGTKSTVEGLERSKCHFEAFFEWLECFGLGGQVPSSSDPAAMRQLKIDRLRRTCDLKAELSIQPDGPYDEEAHRDYWIKWLRWKGLLAIDEYLMLIREIDLLSRNTETTLRVSNSSRNRGKETTVSVSQPFILTREKMRETAFRPGHNLPTMAIDAFLKLEGRRGNIIGGSGGKSDQVDREKDEDFDAETVRLRARDERWDWISRGSGNTFNRS